MTIVFNWLWMSFPSLPWGIQSMCITEYVTVLGVEMLWHSPRAAFGVLIFTINLCL